VVIVTEEMIKNAVKNEKIKKLLSDAFEKQNQK
jgi:hypothetical protein